MTDAQDGEHERILDLVRQNVEENREFYEAERIRLRAEWELERERQEETVAAVERELLSDPECEAVASHALSEASKEPERLLSGLMSAAGVVVAVGSFGALLVGVPFAIFAGSTNLLRLFGYIAGGALAFSGLIAVLALFGATISKVWTSLLR